MKKTSTSTLILTVYRQPVVAFVATMALSALLAARPAAAEEKMANPDFTRGDKIPDGAEHDWNLGATGARGWMYCDKMVTTDARQIAVTKVDKGSPADGLLAVGDVILGVGGKPFSYDPRTELGKALTVAESEAGRGKLSLTRWQAGKTEEITVKLPVLGTYSATAPYDCPKSTRILEQGCKALAERVADPSYRADPIVRSLNALALLASGNPVGYDRSQAGTKRRHDLQQRRGEGHSLRSREFHEKAVGAA